MKAIFVTGGKQYYVAEGDEIFVEKLNAEAGSTMEFTDVLSVGEKTGTPYVKGAKVVVEVGESFKDDKVLVFKYKSKKDYHRFHGHRQQYTKVTVKDVVLA